MATRAVKKLSKNKKIFHDIKINEFLEIDNPTFIHNVYHVTILQFKLIGNSVKETIKIKFINLSCDGVRFMIWGTF